jgi:hypothetical protein
MSRQGDADRVYEDLAELRYVHKKLEDAQESRQRVGLGLSLEDQSILRKFPTEEAALLEKLQGIKADIECLKVDCVQAGLLSVKENGEDGEDSDILTGLDGSTISDYDRFPLLLEQPDNEKDDVKSKSLISQFKDGDPGDRITRWLLHKLRSSCSEVELLARLSASDELDPLADTSKWQEEVLEFWFLDSTTKLPPSAYKVQASITELDMPKSPFADKDNPSVLKSDQAQLIQLVVRSSSLFNRLDFELWLGLRVPKDKATMSVK